ncbi:hypothetical protein [Brevundimonas sp. R86498]|uniref:hypothetical protein n=1 Tax=Brevundimonas sp. R86498 TaxID=3093845 RepID=UPI0037CBFA29
MPFSATEAAFEGFRIVRRKPLSLLWWGALYAVLSLASLAAMVLNADAWIEFIRLSEEMEAAGNNAQADPGQVMAMLGTLGAAMTSFIWLMPLQLVVTSVLTAAIARAILRPSDCAFGYMRLSMDEVRVFVVTLVVLLALFAIYIGCIIGVGLLIGVAAAIGQSWAGLLVIAGILASICLMAWLAVRWSLAVPITVAERRMAFFDSFGLTKGRFWPMLGMAILAGVMAVVIGLLSLIVIAPLSIMSGASMFAGVASDDPASLFEAYRTFNPWMIVTALLNAGVYALTVSVLYAPFSAAYRDIKELPHE